MRRGSKYPLLYSISPRRQNRAAHIFTLRAATLSSGSNPCLRNWIMSLAHSGSSGAESTSITLVLGAIEGSVRTIICLLDASISSSVPDAIFENSSARMFSSRGIFVMTNLSKQDWNHRTSSKYLDILSSCASNCPWTWPTTT